jgi:hypothetical protein
MIELKTATEFEIPFLHALETRVRALVPVKVGTSVPYHDENQGRMTVAGAPYWQFGFARSRWQCGFLKPNLFPPFKLLLLNHYYEPQW